MEEKLLKMQQKGFIAALDQSSGSSEKALEKYGISKERYKSDIEKFKLMHKMRERIMTNKSFNSQKILGVILFEEELEEKIKNEYTPEYLWKQKNIVSFVKIDNGLSDKKYGVQLMKPIEDIEQKIEKAKRHGIIGTKMRSVIYENNEKGISELVKQQFELAKLIYSKGLIPIVEPEVNIEAHEKLKCEMTLKKFIDKLLEETNIEIILKLTLPSIDNFYEEYTNNAKIIKVMALSGGYERDYACEKLSKNKRVIASFSKALLEDLKEIQTETEFNKQLEDNINQIYISSII